MYSITCSEKGLVTQQHIWTMNFDMCMHTCMYNVQCTLYKSIYSIKKIYD